MTNGFTVLGEEERDDFEIVIKRHRHPLNDFQVKVEAREPEGIPIEAVRGDVTVIRASTGVSRKYLVGYGSSWLADFDRDLDGAVFGPTA
jgi:hypothetical protein